MHPAGSYLKPFSNAQSTNTVRCKHHCVKQGLINLIAFNQLFEELLHRDGTLWFLEVEETKTGMKPCRWGLRPLR